MAATEGRAGSKIQVIVDEFQTETEESSRNAPLVTRSPLMVLTLMVVAAVTWMSLGKLDKLVIARASVETSQPRIVVQPMQMALIREIKVDPGEMVKAGQVLAVLDNTFTKADSDQIENHALAIDAQTARLEAERDGKHFSPVITGPSAPYLKLQKAQFDDRAREYTSLLRTYDSRISEARTSIEKRKTEITFLTSRHEVGQEVEKMRKTLLERETGSKLNYLLSHNDRLELERTLELSRSSVLEQTHQTHSLQAERETFVQKWKADIAGELSKLRNERDTLTEQLAKAKLLSQLVILRSPVDGMVLDIAPRSVGSVVQAAETLFRLVPVDAPLEIIAAIPTGNAGIIKVGDEVLVKLDAFPFAEYGTIKAKIRMISGDAFTSREFSPPGSDPLSNPLGAAFYKAWLQIETIELINLPRNFRLVPGMTAGAEIKVGERPIISSLLESFTKSVNEGMRDP